jgi:hypothetical protein
MHHVSLLRAQVALKMFLGVTATVSGWNAEGTACSLVRVPHTLPYTRTCMHAVL